MNSEVSSSLVGWLDECSSSNESEEKRIDFMARIRFYGGFRFSAVTQLDNRWLDLPPPPPHLVCCAQVRFPISCDAVDRSTQENNIKTINV